MQQYFYKKLDYFFTKMWNVLVFIFSFYIKHVLSIEQFVPRELFNMHVHSIENCPGAEDKDISFDLNIVQINSKRRNMVGVTTVKVPVDDNVRTEMTFDKWEGSGWKKNVFRFKQEKGCESLKEFLGPLLQDLMNNCKEGECLKRKPNQLLCPTSPGIYEFKDYDMKRIEDFYFPTAVIGKWRFILKLFTRATDQLLGCVRAIASIEPKKFKVPF